MTRIPDEPSPSVAGGGQLGNELERLSGIDELRALRGAKPNWTVVGEATRNFVGRHRASTLAPRVAVLLEAAAQATGYAANTLSRYVATFDFLETVAEGGGHALAQLSKLQFNSAEVLMRIWRIDRRDAAALIDRTLVGELSYRDLRRIQEAAIVAGGPIARKDPVSAAAADEARFDAIGLIEENLHLLAGNGARLAPIGSPIEYARCDCMALSRRGDKIVSVDAFVVVDRRGEWSGPAMAQMVTGFAVASSYFRRYWLITPFAGYRRDRLVEVIGELKLRTVGIGAIDASRGTITPVLRPAEASPLPDRRLELIATITRDSAEAPRRKRLLRKRRNIGHGVG